VDADLALLDDYAAAVVNSGPVAYFRFDELSGPNLRSLVSTHQAMAEGASFDVPGAVAGNSAVVLDAFAGRIDFGDTFGFFGLAPYTFELLLRASIIDDTRFVLHRESDDGQYGFAMYYGTGYFLFAREAAQSEFGYVNTDLFMADQWTHAAVTFDGEVQRLYINGLEVANNVGAGNPIDGEPGGRLAMGDSAFGQFNRHAGEFDEFAIYDRALSATDVFDHHAAWLTVREGD
jgi:hypothetical protein